MKGWLRRALFSNLFLKLVSLMLAILLYILARPQPHRRVIVNHRPAAVVPVGPSPAASDTRSAPAADSALPRRSAAPLRRGATAAPVSQPTTPADGVRGLDSGAGGG